MSHQDSLTLEAAGISAKTMVLKGPIVPALAEILTPRIADVAPENDRRTFPSQREFADVGDGLGYMFADVGSGFWDTSGAWTLDGNRICPPPKKLDQHALTSVTWNFISHLPSKPIFFAVDPADSISYVYTAAGDRLIKINLSGTPTTLDNDVPGATVGRAVLEFSEPGVSTNRRLYSFWESSTGLNYRRSNHNDYDAWNDGGKAVVDGMVFDNKLIGATPQGELIFTTNGLNWNIDDVNDGKAIIDLADNNRHPISFIGVANAPWGVPSIYFRYRGGIYVVNFDTREYFPIPLQNTIPLATGSIFEGQIAVTDAHNVWLYDPDSQRSTQIGMPETFGGRTPALDYIIRDLFPVGPYLGAMLAQTRRTTPTKNYSILLWNGRGWHQPFASDAYTNAYAEAAGAGVLPINSWENQTPMLVVINASTKSGTNQTLHIDRHSLPSLGKTLTNSIDPVQNRVAAERDTVDLPWLRIYGDLKGVLVQALIHADMPSTSDAAIELFFRTTRDNFAGAPGNFVEVEPGNPMEAGDTPFHKVGFGTKDGDALFPGAPFRRVQLRIAFRRPTNAQELNWPEFYNVTLAFTKISTRKTYTFTIDVPGTIANEVGSSDLQNFSELMKHVFDCVNNPLAKIVVPNFYKSRGIITQVQAARQDLQRDAVSGTEHEVAAPGAIVVAFEEVAPEDSDSFHVQTLPT